MNTMTLDLSPGDAVSVDRIRYIVEDHSSFHEADFRLDLVQLTGGVPVHARWLLAVLPEPHLMLLERLQQDWLAPLSTGFIHEGELFTSLYRGSGHRVRHIRGGGRSKTRMDFALYRANSGRVIFTLAHNDEVEAWIGNVLPSGAVEAPGR